MMKSTAKPIERPVIVKTADRFVDPTAHYAPRTPVGSAAWVTITNVNGLLGELRSAAGEHVINHKVIEGLESKIRDQMEALRATVVNTES